MIACDKQNLGLARIRHTASYSIEKALIGNGWRTLRKKRRHACQPPLKLRHYAWYVVVRDPVRRAWSEYWWFLTGKEQMHRDGYRVAQRVQGMTFEQFIQHALLTSKYPSIRQTQAQFCAVLQPDVVLYFEDLPTCLYELPWWPDGVCLPHTNKCAHGRPFDVSDEARSLIYQWASDDYERFGYEVGLRG